MNRITPALAALAALAGCKGPSEERAPASPPAPAPAVIAAAPAKPAVEERAEVVRIERSEYGETRLFAGSAADLDGDGALELIAGGFSSDDKGRRPTIIAYRQHRERWAPLTAAGWDGGPGSTVRNVEIADVDGDGKPDVIALGRVGATQNEAKARLAVFALERGELVKRAEIDWIDGRYTHGFGLAVADLDGDGRPELVTAGFQFDGTREAGFVRVWSLAKGVFAVRAKTVLDGGGSQSMRINDLAVGDVDGDGRPEIVVAGRRGPFKADGTNKNLDERRELGDLSVLELAGGVLATKARHGWSKGTSMRLRSVAVADLDGDRRGEIVAGGQYDADGKPALGLFALERGGLVLRHDASSTAAGVTGEVKDLVVAGKGDRARIIASGVSGDKPARHGDVSVWHLHRGKLQRDSTVVSRNGDETRVRAAVIVPGANGSTVLTIGHAKDGSMTVGQVLEWPTAGGRR